MYTIAYKWRLSTTRYAYITSTQYRVDGSEPDYTLAQIPATGKLDDATEQIIKDIVRNMSADEYRQCFEYMVEKIANDKDGQYIKLKNWEYYYHFNTNENGDEKVFFVDATASATISNDGEAHAEVVNDRGTLKFTFQIPQGINGRDGVDGKDGAPGVPVNDGKYLESIYKLTTTDNAPLIKLDDDWDIEGSEYQINDYLPNGWTNRPSGITSIYKYEWVSTRKYDLVKKLWGEFSEPAMMSRWGEDGKDGDGIEYIYKRTTDEINPGAPTVADWENENSDYQTNDEYAKFLEYLGWTDEPVGPEKNGYKFEWVSVRKQKDGVWQQFSTPALWSTYGKDGDDVEYIYFLNNDNEVPSFDNYDINSDDYQSEDFRPTTNGVLWTDNYQSPTYEKRFSWISSRRKRDGKWLDFTGTSLFNVYKIGGKAYVDLYTRSNTRVDHHNLPSYDGNIYYSFNSDRFYSDANLINEITTVNGLNKTVWYTDMPADNTAKMLFKTSALIEIKNDFNEIVAIPESSWYGPYLLSSNGENATNQTPYINLNDNSLPLPINEENKPHKEYLHSLVGKLLVNDVEAEITEANISTSSDKNIKINSENINKDTNEFHLTFTINKDEKFTNIGIIYITLKGLYEDKEVIANTQYKIVPFYSDNAVTYKMLLNQNSVFVPDNACEILPDGGIWNTQITAHVIDDKGENVTIGDLLYEYETNKYKSFKDNNNSEGITGTLKLIGCNNEEYLANDYKLIQSLPNPLRLIYEINGKTLEIGYVDFNNMPKDGKNGISTRTIFAYCSTEEGITPNTPKDGGVDFITNEVTYPNGVDVNGNVINWGNSIPLTGVVWLSTCEFSSDTSSGLWSTPIRLTGFKGTAGVSAYHLELTNDMDQVYTTDDNVVIKDQKVETIVSILNGNAPMYITADSITVTSVNGFKVDKVNTTNTEVKITFELTGTTLTAKTINFNISVNGDDYGTTNFDFVKTFKIKNLNGTVDYDLDVTPTFIKKDKTGKYSTDKVNIKITKRDLAVDAKNITIADVIPSGYSLHYKINDNAIEGVTNYNSGYNITLSTFNTIINKITIILCDSKEYNINNIVDIAYIECVSDGVDGSAYHIELTNEFEQVYTINGKCLPNQSGSTEVLLFNSTASANIKSLNVSDEYNSICTADTIDNKTVKIQFKNNAEINDKILNFKISATTEEDNIIEKTFKYIVLEGNKDYDLNSSHSYIKRAGDKLSTTAITFTVTESTIGTHERKIETLTTLPEVLSFKFVIGGVTITSNKFNKNGKFVLELDEFIGKFKNGEKLEAYLLSGDSPVDYIAIETISDGKDGESPYHIELSNDMDQILTVDGVVKHNQEISTILSLYYGSSKDTGLTIEHIALPQVTGFTITGETVGSGGDVKIIIKPNTGVTLDIGKNYEFPIGINQDKTNLKFNIEKLFKTVVLNTSIDYDLFVSNGMIKKTVNGYDTTQINIKVKKTDISRSDRSIAYLTSLDNTNLYIKIFKDNAKDPISNATYNESGITLNISELLPNTNILVQLYKKNDNNTNTLIDESVIEVVSDGKNGEPGVDGTNIEFIYKLFKDEADFNSVNNLFPNNSSITGTTKEEVLNQLNTKIGENTPKWSDSPCGITKDYKIEVSSQRIKEPGKTKWGSWSDAFIWSKWGEDGIDGDGVEYIFQVTDRNITPFNPGGDIKSVLDKYTGSTLSALTEIVNTFDFFPGEKWITGNTELIKTISFKYNLNESVFSNVVNSLDFNWTDDPSDVGPYEPLEWVSIRRKKVNLDGTFEYTYSEPTIWAEWKRDTYDSLTEFMFTIYDSRVDLSQCTVTGCTWKDVKDGTVYSGVKTISGGTELDIEWKDSVPNHNMFTQSVWMVKGFASGEIEYTGDANDSGITYSEIEWTSPTKLIDNQHMQVEYGIGIKDNMGQLVVPKPINLQDIVSGLGLNYDYTELENAFRERDKNSGYDFQWTDNPTGESPTWMITSTFYNGVWSDWVVSKIKGEKGETGETGQSIQIKGSFETLEDLQNAYEYFKNPAGKDVPSKYFNDDKLEIGDSYIVNESVVDGEKVFGYLYVFVKDDENFESAWESVGQIKGESSFIYIAYASSVTIDNSNIKTYHLTEGGIINNENYYGTTPGKYIGIHVATQQYEGHPYPPKLYSSSSVTETSNTFLWNKWEGEDGFGQEQIFILSGETAPKVPVYGDYSSVTSIIEWNSNDFEPEGWSDVPLTTSGSDNERCCWMATRRFPFNGEGANEFKGVSGNTGVTAILFSYYASDGNDGESPIHVELSNEMEQIYTIDNVVNVTQTASTIITVYSGGTQITDFSVNGNNATNSEYVFNKEYIKGDVITENEVKNLLDIKVNDTTITRTFKIIKLNGTKDYDLDVTPTYLRVNKNGVLTYTEPISVKVTESEIGSTNVAKKTINIDDANLKIIYTYDGQTKEYYFTGGTENKISVTSFSKYCKIYLVNENGDTLDYVQIEKLYDGTDGQPGASGQSPFHIELSNEFDLISVVNGCVNGTQTYSTSFELWEGDVDRTKTITSITITNIGEGLTPVTGSSAFTLTFNDGYELNETIYGLLKVNTDNNKSHHRTFTIKPINDSVIHQLQVDKGYVVNGESSEINISAVTKTNSGVILMSDNIDKKIKIKNGSSTAETTGNTYTYDYTGGTNDIVINLYVNGKLYDYIFVETKNDIKPSGTLNISPLNQIVYVEKIENEGENVKYKPLVSSVKFDASFVYEGVEMPVSGINISVSGSANDFSATHVISDYGIEVKYLDDFKLTTDNLTKERYVFETKYGNDTYYNNFFITYVEPKLDVWVDGDCIYIPDDNKGGLSKEFIFEAKFENSNVTHDCVIEVEGYTGITFNLRNNSWYINIPSEVISDDDLTGFTINFTYNGISASKEVTIIRRGKNSENWYINVFPKYLSIVNEPINLYITKNNYNGEYISLENALTQNMKLYYIIDGECVNVDENGNEITASEICYSNNLGYAPKEYGNNAFYPNGCLITSTTTSITEDNVVEEITITGYTQEPIYSSIEFKLYYELDNNTKELVASEKVERFDVIRNSETTRMPASGLKIDVKELFEDYDSEKYDIVIKEIKK